MLKSIEKSAEKLKTAKTERPPRLLQVTKKRTKLRWFADLAQIEQIDDWQEKTLDRTKKSL